MEEQQRITNRNFKSIFPNAPFSFEVLSKKPGFIERKMKRDNSFNLVNFLYINDIIYILEKNIKETKHLNKRHKEKWQYFLENDIQEYLDNEHERKQNET